MPKRKSGRELLQAADEAVAKEVYFRRDLYGESVESISADLKVPTHVVNEWYCKGLQLRNELARSMFPDGSHDVPPA